MQVSAGQPVDLSVGGVAKQSELQATFHLPDSAAVFGVRADAVVEWFGSLGSVFAWARRKVVAMVKIIYSKLLQ